MAVALAFVLSLTLGHAVGSTLEASGWAMSYLTDFTEPWGRPSALVGHTWSLAVEEQFYLLWPPLLLAVLTWRGTRVWIVASAIAALAAGLSAVLHPELGDKSYFLPLTYVPSLLIGGAFAARAHHPYQVPTWCAIGALAVLATAVYAVPWLDWKPLYYGGWVVISLLSLTLIAAVERQGAPMRRALSVVPLVWLGRRSYGIYLFSAPITALETTSLRISTRDLICLVATIAVAAISFRFVEQPALQRKRRFQPLATQGAR